MYPIEQDLKIVTEYIQKEKVMEYIQFEGQKKISDNLSVFCLCLSHQRPKDTPFSFRS